MTLSDHAALHAAAGDAAHAALQRLRRQGDRVTAPRRAVIDVLAQNSLPMSADEVAAELGEDGQRSGTAHRTTVYRTLVRLVESGIVTHISPLGGAAHYHLATLSEPFAHLHATCRVCAAIVPLSTATLNRAVALAQSETGFTIDADQCVLVGVCEQCRERAGRRLGVTS